MTKPNATVVFDEVKEINERGIVSGAGQQYDVDVIVCATGFDVSHKPAFPVYGTNGLNLQEFWDKSIVHYLSVTAPGFPNYFSKEPAFFTGEILSLTSSVVGGPNSTISNVSLIYGLEASIDYAYKCLKKMQEEGIASLEVKTKPTEEFLDMRDEIMKEHVWTGSCSSWYVKSAKE